MHEGDDFSAKPFGKSRFQLLTDWSSNGQAGQIILKNLAPEDIKPVVVPGKQNMRAACPKDILEFKFP